MRSARSVAVVIALAAAISGCADRADVPADPTPTPSPAAAAGPTPSAPSQTAVECDDTGVLTSVAASLEAARLTPVTAWSDDASPNRFAERTTTGEAYARRLGFDCGLVGAEVIGTTEERLLLAAWTGARMAWVVQSTEAPAMPYAPEATVTVVVGDTEGEWLDAARTVWAGTLPTGETFVVGHVDFSLGAAAKGWVASDTIADKEGDGEGEGEGDSEDGLLAAERHGIAALGAAGMREADIAEPAEIGSEEGHLQFVSPTGQISVADVAPTGWFDPMTPRYHEGPTRVEMVDGAQVRVTEPGPDAPEYARVAEVAFACDEFVWLLQPPANGDTDELLASAAAILSTDACRPGR